MPRKRSLLARERERNARNKRVSNGRSFRSSVFFSGRHCSLTARSPTFSLCSCKEPGACSLVAFCFLSGDAMRSSALLSSRVGGVIQRRQVAVVPFRQRRQWWQRRMHSSSPSTSTQAIWGGLFGKGTTSNKPAADASTDTEASLLEAMGKRWEGDDTWKRERKRNGTANAMQEKKS